MKKDAAEELEAIPINQDAYIYASILSEGREVTHKVHSPGRRLYVHLVQNGGSIKLTAEGGKTVTLSEGDGDFIEGVSELKLTGLNAKSEFLLFDLV